MPSGEHFLKDALSRWTELLQFSKWSSPATQPCRQSNAW